MSKITKEMLETINENKEKLYYDDYDLEAEPMFSNFKVAMAAQWGGEGQGDKIGYVLKLTDKQTEESEFVRVTGYYQSHYGADWYDNAQLVEPFEVIKTEWKEKSNA